jgi:hypothetical protein
MHDRLIAAVEGLVAQQPGDGRAAVRELRNSAAPPEWFEETAALGRMPFPVNCADASPDGRWLAVSGDSPTVLLLSEALDYDPLASVGLADPKYATQLDPLGRYALWQYHKHTTGMLVCRRLSR